MDPTERQWQATVVQMAGMYRWHHYHAYDSRRSNKGWPDLTLVRPPEFMVVELKSNTGRLRPEQAHWLDWLSASGVETHVWRPRDFDAVLKRLSYS